MKTMKPSHSLRPMKKNPLLLSMAMLCVAGASAHAAVVVTSTALSGNTPFTVSSTDLLQTTTVTITPGTGDMPGDFANESSGGLPTLNNGIFQITQSGNNNLHLAAISNNKSFNIGLDLVAQPAGYDLSSIVTYGGWRSDGRDDQRFTISYATVAAPMTFLDIGTVNFTPASFAGDRGVMTVFADNAGAPIALNAAIIRFTFPVQENNFAGYGEIDVFVVPEPSSALLGCSGLLGLLLLRRR